MFIIKIENKRQWRKIKLEYSYKKWIAKIRPCLCIQSPIHCFDYTWQTACEVHCRVEIFWPFCVMLVMTASVSRWFFSSWILSSATLCCNTGILLLISCMWSCSWSFLCPTTASMSVKVWPLWGPNIHMTHTSSSQVSQRPWMASVCFLHFPSSVFCTAAIICLKCDSGALWSVYKQSYRCVLNISLLQGCTKDNTGSCSLSLKKDSMTVLLLGFFKSKEECFMVDKFENEFVRGPSPLKGEIIK